MTDFIGEFLDALRAAGFEPRDKIIADDKWHPAYYGGEKKSCSGTYSMKIVNNDFAIGCYFTRKDPENKHNWHSASGELLSPEERKKINKRIKAEQHKREVEEKKRHLKISRRLTRFINNLDKTKDHPYLKKKGISHKKVRVRKKTNELIIPLYGADGKVWTIQKINEKGGKYLFAGGRKKGCYFPLTSSKDDKSVLIVTEGFATGVSIRKAAGKPVFVAIDSGNLPTVVMELKKKYPKSKILIAADNDAFTKNQKGELWNVGLEAANKASQAIGGAYVVSPDFSKLESKAYQESKPTDFNDLHAFCGEDEVKDQIFNAYNRIPVYQDEAVSIVDDSQVNNQRDTGGESPPDEDDPDRIKGDFGMDFKILGYNDGLYYYFPFKERQIVALSAPAHSNLPNLYRLDNSWAWRTKFGSNDPKVTDRTITSTATAALMDLAQTRGYFKAEEKIRGAGAWLDKGRTVLHCGDVLYMDGKEIGFDSIETENTYIVSSKLLSPSKEPLPAKEAIKLRQICESVTWENPLSGSLLAGWIVIAPICGLLSFRPHLFINGEVSSGKSTVTDKIIKPAIGKIALEADGGTTEPKLRQIMEYDARPIIYDEAENAPSFGAVIALARAATNGKVIGKFGQKITKARYCFCFSAVNPPIEKTADETRMIFMTIKKNKKSTAIEDYNNLIELIEDTLTPEYSNRMLARTLKHIQVLRKNIQTFKKATRRVLKDPRASELFGTVFAGLYLLSRSDAVSLEDAEAWIEKQDWSSYIVDDQDTDPMRLLQYLSGCIIRVSRNGKFEEHTIGDLIVLAGALQPDGAADKALRYHGIAVKDGRVYVASRNQHLAKLLKDTDWSLKWTRMLLNVEGAEKFRMLYFVVGCKTSGTSLPLSLFKEDESTPDPQQDMLQPELTQEEIEIEGEEIPFYV